MVPILIYAIVGAWGLLYISHAGPGQPVRSDGEGYYAYLPSFLLDHDLSMRAAVARHLGSIDTESLKNLGLQLQQSTGNYYDKYPIGVAVMMSPFFLAGHLIATLTGAGADGYSTAELDAAGFAAVVYGSIGILALRACLRRYFPEAVTVACLVALALGTDFFHYATYDTSFSHVFSFGLISLLLLQTHRWYEAPSTGRAVALGMVAGFVVLVRPVDAVYLLVIPLFGITSRADVHDRIAVLHRRWTDVATVALIACAVEAPQLAIWRHAAGRWVLFSYRSDEYFSFTSPHLLDELVSFHPHGLLPWAPVLILALVGLVTLRRHAPAMVAPVAVVLPINYFVISSWYSWYYGGGFGQRAFIDALPLLAFPLGSLYASLRPGVLRLAIAALTAAAVAVTTVLMLRYWQGRIPLTGIDARGYVRLLFGG